ncbi:MAG: hypothetical protein ACE5EU_07400 [Paracoccaceae bacterium]
MNKFRLLAANVVLTCVALLPAASLADEELDVTMDVIDDLASVEGVILETRGPDGGDENREDGAAVAEGDGPDHDGEGEDDYGEGSRDDGDVGFEDDDRGDFDFGGDFGEDEEGDEGDDVDLDEPDEPANDGVADDGTDAGTDAGSEG